MSVSFVSAAILWSVLTAVPPLSDDQAARVNGAVDGADYHDEAFLALVENVRGWTPGLGDEPIRLNPDFAAMMEAPASYRGQLCRITGMLQQATKLTAPYEHVTEWFVRRDDNHALVVYIVGAADAAAFKDFDPVETDARFYKRMEFVARDGKKHTYPAFVGAFPRRGLAGATVSQGSPAQFIGGMVVLLGIVFVAVLLWTRRSGGRHARLRIQEHRSASLELPRGVDDSKPLPDDPAQALAELKRRAEVDASRQE